MRNPQHTSLRILCVLSQRKKCFTLRSLLCLQNVHFYSSFCSKCLSGLALILLQHSGVYLVSTPPWITEIKTAPLSFSCCFPLATGNLTPLFQQCYLVGSFFHASFLVDEIVCINIGQHLRSILLVKEERGIKYSLLPLCPQRKKKFRKTSS